MEHLAFILSPIFLTVEEPTPPTKPMITTTAQTPSVAEVTTQETKEPETTVVEVVTVVPDEGHSHGGEGQIRCEKEIQEETVWPSTRAGEVRRVKCPPGLVGRNK